MSKGLVFRGSNKYGGDFLTFWGYFSTNLSVQILMVKFELFRDRFYIFAKI